MKRGEFLRSLGLSTSTLMAFYCLGTTMTACGSSDDDPDPDPTPGGGNAGTGIIGTISGSAVNFTVDLTKVTAVKAAGGFQVIGDTIVAHTNSGSYIALSKTCTHQGTTIGFRAAQNDFLCPNHGSQFSTTGSVEEGPATTALKVYKTTLSADGNTLTVTA
ncbi:QcrA and Rieske domain-containing protein [Dyadobacter arcticus]|uniref:Cytochrome b6-f complex iron-sulfur subunit n=1 Tax=Dyadobacter arcticus TaxID=1078754 RepID=A0ABX0UUI1_9BACT|nr:Rieske (2Fe-2S) protein [Dyadobacter arcticus]NIJ55554.1 cytochrome b6-f complex iron-sulfur subunit [Dyadobacter arcticus]